MNVIFLTLPFFAQGLLMAVDEFYFHHRRRLGRWESVGHPLDTLTFIAPLLVALRGPLSEWSIGLYLVLSGFSCLFITKD